MNADFIFPPLPTGTALGAAKAFQHRSREFAAAMVSALAKARINRKRTVRLRHSEDNTLATIEEAREALIQFERIQHESLQIARDWLETSHKRLRRHLAAVKANQTRKAAKAKRKPISA